MYPHQPRSRAAPGFRPAHAYGVAGPSGPSHPSAFSCRKFGGYVIDYCSNKSDNWNG